MAEITLQGTIRDFSPTTHPDFEATIASEKNIVGPLLDPTSRKPVYKGGTGKTTHGPIEFAKWYASNHPAQKPFVITLSNTATPNPDVFSYSNQKFFPIDNDLLGNEGRQHNYHFTYEVNTQFTYKGGEKFTFTGDDDLWVFIDNKLVIDLGGIHNQVTDSVELDRLKWLPDGTPIVLELGKTYSLDVFFAERHTTESHFRIDTSIVLTQPVATILASDPDANELGLDAGEFTLNLDKAAITDLVIKYTVAGTATDGADYQPIVSSVLVPKGLTSAKLPVTPIADQLAEGPETVIVTLIGGGGYQTGTPSSATVTIADNPPPIATIVANDPQASEIGLDPGQFTISLDKAALNDLTIVYAVTGTATEGTDYQPIGRSVLIPQGQTSAKIPVTPIADPLPEAPETVVATLLAGAGYQLGAGLMATVTIADNPPPVATIVATDPQASEIGLEPGQFTISLDKVAMSNLTIAYTVAGTATEGADYQPIGQSIVIPQGQSSAVIPVNPIADQLSETPETVVVTLQAGSGYQLSATISATVTIADNPPQVFVTLTASDGTATKPRPGQPVSDTGTFTISLDRPAPTNLIVSFSVAGTASEGQDCQPMPRSAAIAQGQAHATIPVVPMVFTPQRVAAGVTHVIATLQPSNGCQLGAKITDTVFIKVPQGSAVGP